LLNWCLTVSRDVSIMLLMLMAPLASRLGVIYVTSTLPNICVQAFI
jgi:hypothetical protein